MLAAQVLFQVPKTLNIFLHFVPLRIRHEDQAIHTPENQLSSRVINHLAGDCVQLEFCFETLQHDRVHRQKIKKKGSIGCGCQRNEVATITRRDARMDVLQVGRLPTERRPVIDNLEMDLFASVVDDRHGSLRSPMTIKLQLSSRGSMKAYQELAVGTVDDYAGP